MKPCLFSISYAGLWGQARLSTTQFVGHAAALGFPAVMLAGKRPHLSPLDSSQERVDEILAALGESRVACDVVAAYTNLAQPPAVGCEVPLLEMQIAYVESLTNLAARLGARIVRVFTAYENDAMDLQTAWQRAVVTLREMADRAAAYGVTLAIQNHHDLALDTDALLELLADIGRPNCKLGFDAWSPALRGEPLFESARKAAPHTAITTNADYIRLPRHRYRPELVNYESLPTDWVRAVPFGTGFIDYAAFFSGLREGGFDGIAVYEICSPVRGGGELANLDACAIRYLEWMRNRNWITT